MVKRVFKISNKLGIHARPASQLVRIASKYKSQIHISKNGNEVNGKSIMGVLMLEAGFGSEILLKIDGEDESAAIEALTELIQVRHFDEE